MKDVKAKEPQDLVSGNVVKYVDRNFFRARVHAGCRFFVIEPF